MVKQFVIRHGKKIIPAAKVVVEKAAPVVLSAVIEKIPQAINEAADQAKEFQIKMHGSYVEYNDYAGCPIEKRGDDVFIVTDKKNKTIVSLDEQTVKECKFLEEKKKVLFYRIEFIDGKKSRIRVNSEYRTAMDNLIQSLAVQEV